MRSSASVAVLERNLGWVVAINGSIRPILDWFLSAERALDVALGHADELGVGVVAVVRKDGETSFVSIDGDRSSRYSQVA
jgi:hypothetical protein